MKPFPNLYSMFTAQERFYAKNHDNAENTYVRPSLQATPDGSTEPTVTIFTHDEFRSILPIPDALRIATQIADAIQYHKENTPA